MKELNKEMIPLASNATPSDVIVDGFIAIMKGHQYDTICLFPECSDVEESDLAFTYLVARPYGRDAAINAAEMAAYGLHDAMDVASFNAALARKWREQVDDPECVDHDEFIRAVKNELTRIGIV